MFKKAISSLVFLVCTSLFINAQTTVFHPAEFEKNEGVLLVWDYNASRDSIVANIAKAAQHAGKVWIIYYPDQAPMDTAEIRAYLYENGVLPLNLYLIPGYTETLWVRDFGPMIQYGDFGNGSERYVVDAGYSAYNRPKDDSLPAQIANLWEMPQQNLPLEIEGGNLVFDGLMRGFSTKRVFDQNPDFSPATIRQILIDQFNLQDFIFLETLDNSGGGIWKHADMFMKALDYETLLVSSYPDFLPDYSVLEMNVALLSSLTTHFGKPYRIIRIPAPPKADGTWATTWDDEMRTYTNSLIINNTVIVPSYQNPEYDTQAYQIYREALPGYKIIMVDAQMLTVLGGAIHCVTREVPQAEFMRIIHQKVTGTQDYSQDFYLYCLTEANVNIENLWLHYKINDAEQYTRVPVYIVCPEYTGIIEGLLPSDTIHYYLEAVSANGSVTYPGSAPAGNLTFWFNPVGNPELARSDNTVRVAPQPNNGRFTITGLDQDEIKSCTIYNPEGCVVWQDRAMPSAVIDIDLAQGIYLLRIELINKTISQKLIITP